MARETSVLRELSSIMIQWLSTLYMETSVIPEIIMNITGRQ